ncbi:MAG: envelope stress response membrane protein PspB [Chromatiales bacterium]|jgi:phage shock protein B|nr:envelope stress response membrane protein PspB [Chromatiales bacterium]MDH4029332.1 envelope stress response membrane protein PspB [Chromatiales bacterium]
MPEVIGVILVSFVLPLIVVLHYMTKWKSSKGLSREDEKMLEEIWESAQKMESRINALETILDDQAPDWRRRV